MGNDEATAQSHSGGRSAGVKSRPSSTAGSLCAFWLGERCFALETRLVGEVVTVEDFIVLPLAPPAVRGVFNLRGEPVPLVDTEQVLGLTSEAHALPKTPRALVLREHDLVVGLLVTRVQGVLSAGAGDLRAVASAEDDPGLIGFLELDAGAARTVISVLAPDHLLERVNALRYARGLPAS